MSVLASLYTCQSNVYVWCWFLLALCAIFFVTYLVRHQKFSEEEKKVMFKAYLINANRKKRLNMLKNNKVGAMMSGSQSDINQVSQSRDRANSQTVPT